MIGKICWLSIGILFVAGCSTIPLKLHESVSREELIKNGYVLVSNPVVIPKGGQYDCGPEVASALFAYWGIDVPVSEAALILKTDRSHATLSIDLIPFFRRKGLSAKPLKGTIGSLKNGIDAGKPSIIMLEVASHIAPFSNPLGASRVFHFFLVTGYNDSQKTVFCPAPEGKGYEIAYAVLDDYWKNAGYFMLDVKPMGPDDYFDLAADAESKGDYASALSLFRKALDLDSRHAQSLVGMGNCLLSVGKKDEALKAYQEASKLNPNDPKLLNNLANLYGALGQRIDEAARLSENAVTGYRAEIARIEERLQHEASSSERERQTVRRNELQIELAYALGTLGQLRFKTKNFLGAVAAWQSSIETIPLKMFDFRAKRNYEIGLAYVELKDPKKARESLSEATALVKDPLLREEIEKALKALR